MNADKTFLEVWNSQVCYGQRREEVISNTERLAIEVIADRITQGELPPPAIAHL